MISSDSSLLQLAEQYGVEIILTGRDSGYSKDAMDAITALSQNDVDKVAHYPN